MGNAIFLVCYEKPNVSEELGNFNTISKETIHQVCQLIIVPGPYYQIGFPN